MESVKIKTINKNKMKRKRFEEITAEAVPSDSDIKIKKTNCNEIIGDSPKKEKKRRKHKKEIDEDDRNHERDETNNKETLDAGIKIKKTKKASIEILRRAAKKGKKRRKHQKEIDEDDRNHKRDETYNKETDDAGINIMKNKPKKEIIEGEGQQNAKKKNGKHKSLVNTDPSESDRGVISKDDAESLAQDDESDTDYEEIDAWCNDLDEESNEKYLSITSQIKDLLEKVQYKGQAPQKTKAKKKKNVTLSLKKTEQKNKNSKHIHFD